MTKPLDDAVYAQTLTEYQPRPIRDDAENERATGMLERIAAIENPTTEQEAVAEILVTLIEAYEERYAMKASTPLSMLRELMAANDLKQKDIASVIGSKGVTSEVLSTAVAELVRRWRTNLAHDLTCRTRFFWTYPRLRKS